MTTGSSCRRSCGPSSRSAGRCRRNCGWSRAVWTGGESRKRNSERGYRRRGPTNAGVYFAARSALPRGDCHGVFRQLGSALPAIAAGFGDLHVTEQAGDLAEAVLVQSEATGPALCFIQFERDTLGRWLIGEV